MKHHIQTLVIFFGLPFCTGYRMTTPKSQLYGEWTVWHSHHSSSKGSNRMLVGLYPESIIEVCYREYQGHWLIETRKIGEFQIQDDFIYNSPSIRFNQRQFDPVSKSNVCVFYQKKERKILSFLGIGFDDISPLRTEEHHVRLNMTLYIVDRNDLFLTISDQGHYHLMRSIRVNEPSVNVPISTLIATNLFGMVMTAVLHHYYFTNAN
jgi:hypothetical protein